MSDSFNLAHWVFNMDHPVGSCAEWINLVQETLSEAKAEGMDMLLMPEYACESWIKFAPPELQFTDELAWMANQAVSNKVIEHLQKAVDETGVALAAGTMPWPVEGMNAFTNRAWILFPQSPAVSYDKLVRTPFEKNPAGWVLHTGDTVRIFDWKGVRIAIVICLDIEMPSLAAKIADKDIDLLLVPAMTEKLSSYHRVFDCAKARAIELMTCVGVAACTGYAWHGDVMRLPNVGSAALYLPCELKLGSTGVHATLPVMDKATGKGPVLYSRDIPVGIVRELRRQGAEAWPGPWDAGHIKVTAE